MDGARSPVEIDLEQFEQDGSFGRGTTWLIGGPGYAWKSVQINPRGDQTLVRLDRAGSVAVDVSGVGSATGLNLFVSTPEHETTIEVRLTEDRSFRLGRWPVGPVQVRAQRGDWFSKPAVFGAVDGVVVVDEELRLELAVDAEAEAQAQAFDLALEVIAPAGWALEELELALELEVSPSGVEGRVLRTATPVEPADPTRPQRFLFELGSQPAGTWIAEFDPGQWRAVVTLEASGTQQLTLPEPATVTLATIDPNTGAPVEDAHVSWYCTLDGPVSGWTLETAEALPEPGLYEFSPPATEIIVNVRHEDYGTTNETYELAPGSQTLTLELAPLVGLALRLLEGDKDATPTGWGWWPQLHAAGSDEPYFDASRSFHDGKMVIWPADPGLYELHFPELDGYEPIEPLEIDLKPGEIQDIDVQVVGKR